MAEVVVEDREIRSYDESGAHRALRSERELRKRYEREAAALKHDLAARVTRLEQRGLTPVLDAMAEWRRDQAGEVGQLRAELKELAEQVDQLAAMVKARP